MSAALFAVSVALTGAIIVNRYDAAVALLIAVFLLCLCQRWFIAAAFVLGLGLRPQDHAGGAAAPGASC